MLVRARANRPTLLGASTVVQWTPHVGDAGPVDLALSGIDLVACYVRLRFVIAQMARRAAITRIAPLMGSHLVIRLSGAVGGEGRRCRRLGLESDWSPLLLVWWRRNCRGRWQ